MKTILYISEQISYRLMSDRFIDSLVGLLQVFSFLIVALIIMMVWAFSCYLLSVGLGIVTF